MGRFSKRLRRSTAILLAVILSLPGAVGSAVSAQGNAGGMDDALYGAFQTPAHSTKPAPLCFWNREVADMTTEKVREIVRESYLQSGYSGFGILPEWQEEYLSEEYFALYEAALDEGSKYGMQFSLYDEDGFPSYNAGGLYGINFPDLTTKVIENFEATASDGQTVTLELVNGKFMGAVAMNTDTYERINISGHAVIVETGPFDPAKEPVGTTASSTFRKESGYEAFRATDGDMQTRWNAESNSAGGQYLQVKFEDNKTFDNIKVYEPVLAALHRIKAFEIQYYDYDLAGWVAVAEGTTITNAGAALSFEPVTSDLIRLFIGKVSADSATISEFEIYSGQDKLEIPETIIYSERPIGYHASTEFEQPGYEADKAFDGDESTRWNAKSFTAPPHWIEMAFGSERTVDKAVLKELTHDNIRAFSIQYWNGYSWANCEITSGAPLTTIGANKVVEFTPVQTTSMRIYITDNINLPTINEIEFYNGDEKLQLDEEATQTPAGSYLRYTVPDGNWKVMAYVCTKSANNGMDYLSYESVKGFIQITHEEYYKRFKQYFDNGTITTAFYDEPTFWNWGSNYGAPGGKVWTPLFNEDYLTYFPDHDPVLDYPALFEDIGEATTEARNRLHYVRTELFANNYIGQMNEWCRDHGIELTGHMLLEEWTNPVGLHGDLMKVFKNQAIPGVDVIGHFGYTQEAYKIISSSAYNWDKGKVMSETYGVFGGTDGVNLYQTAMDQFAKGVNVLIPHAVWYDDDPRHVTFVPELSYRSPYFGPILPALNEFSARGHILLQNGRHVADIAMLYPIDYLESEFLFNGTPNNNVEGADYMSISETLSLTARRDFTYLHPDIIDQKIVIDGDTMRLPNDVNYEDYKVFIMPGTKVISLSNLEKIKEFYDAGGKVIATTLLPFKGINVSENESVVEIIKEMFNIDPVSGPLPDPNRLKYAASSIYSPAYNASMAFDGISSDTSRWNSSAADVGPNQWLEVEFPTAQQINRVVVKERFGRVSGYRIEYFEDGQWKTAATGTLSVPIVDLVKTEEKIFDTVTTNRLRIYITNSPANDTVSIDEFEVYYNDSENLALNKFAGIIEPAATNENGGRTYFLESNPRGELLTVLDEVLDVYDVEIDEVPARSGGNFSYIHKVKDDRNIYYFANSSFNGIDTDVYLRGEINRPMLWDPHDGSMRAADYEVIETPESGAVTKVHLSLQGVKSVFIVESLKEIPDPVNKEALAALVAQAAILDAQDYTAQSWAPFAQALAAAVQVLADDSAAQETVNAACNELDTAMKALEKVGGGEHIPVSKIKINASGLFTLSVKKKAQIPVSIEPEDATDQTVKWISTNTNIFTVDAQGNITPKKQGTATLTAQSSNGLKSTIIVRITA